MLVTHMCALSLLTLTDFAFVKCRRLKKNDLEAFFLLQFSFEFAVKCCTAKVK